MYDRDAFETYARIPASVEVITRREKQVIDLRSLDDAARRGAYDNVNKPVNRIPFNKKVEVITQVLGPDRATNFVIQCKVVEYIKRKESFSL